MRLAHRTGTILIVAALAMAAGGAAADPGAGYPGGILRHSGTVLRAGMAEAGVALGGDTGSLYHNPASLLRAERNLGVNLMQFSDGPFGSTYAASASWFRLGDEGRAARSAAGILMVRSAVDGIVPRGVDNAFVPGSMEYFDQALMAGAATEFVGRQGVLGVGLNMKIISQGLSGAGHDLRGSGFGMDLGVQYQPIHPFLLEKVAGLRRLLPLRLGATLQNAIRPGVGLNDGFEESVPTMLRLGAAYDLHRVDKSRGDGRPHGVLTVVLDWDRMYAGDLAGRGDGFYLGSQYHFVGTDLLLRAGLNRVGDEPGLSFGFSYTPPQAGRGLRIDYAYVTRDLSDQHRFGLTWRWGRPHAAEDYRPAAAVTDTAVLRGSYLRMLAEYPGAHVPEVAQLLASDFDTERGPRYYPLIRGLAVARLHYGDMRRSLQSRRFDAVDEHADDAVAGFVEAVADGEEIVGVDALRYAEALLTGAVSREQAATASGLAEGWEGPDEHALTARYLAGAAQLRLGDRAAAAERFASAGAAATSTDEGRMTRLLAGFGEALARGGDAYADLAAAGDLPVPSDAMLILPLGSATGGIVPEGTNTMLGDDVLFAWASSLRDDGRREDARRVVSRLMRFYPNSPLAGEALGILAP